MPETPETTFGTEIADEDDPFAGTDFGDFGNEDSPAMKELAATADVPVDTSDLAEPPSELDPEPEPELPIVNAEGTVIGSAPAQVGPTPEAQAALEALREYRRAHPEEATPETAPAAQTTSESPSPAAESPATAVEVPQDPPQAPEAAPEPAADVIDHGVSGDQSPVSDAPATPMPAAETSEDEYVPPEHLDEKGRATHRPYVVLRMTAPGKYEQVTWFVDGDGKMGPKGPGMKRQSYAVERSVPDALVVGYRAVGAPVDGAVLVAVPRSQFRQKTVKPKPPEPSRTRLSIS